MNDTISEKSIQLAAMTAERNALRTWHPIETAPRDGTTVLLANPSGRITDGAWHVEYAVWAWPYVLMNPTHWMKCPSPPEKP